MEDIIKMVMAIIAAGVGAICGVYAVAFVATGVIAAVGGLVSGVVSAAPAMICLGGVAVVAAHQGH